MQLHSRSGGILRPVIYSPEAGEFKIVNEQGRGRLVPVKRRATDKTRGRGRSRPILERTVPYPMPKKNYSISRIGFSVILTDCRCAMRVFRLQRMCSEWSPRERGSADFSPQACW